MHELDRHVLGVAQAPAVSHDEELRAALERVGHRPGAGGDPLGVFGEEPFLRGRALPAFPEDLLAHVGRHQTSFASRWRP